MGRSLNLWLAVLVVVCGVSLWLAGEGTLPGGGEAEPGVTDKDQGPLPPLAPVHLRIQNGAGVPGLAREISLQVVPLGCVVEGVGNAANADTPVSLLINRRLDRAAASDLARRLGGLPVVRQFDPRTTEDAVLVLGRDHARVARHLSGG